VIDHTIQAQFLDEACTTWAVVDIELSGAKIVCPFRYACANLYPKKKRRK